MARTIHHVDLTVSEMERAKRFYKPVMERLGYRMTLDTAQDLCFDAGDGTGIALHPARAASREKKHDRYSPGLHHLAFKVSSREEVDGLHALLKRMGAKILDPPAIYYPPDYHAVFFADLDGLKLELAFKPRGH
jgi:glyoxylase I family protein